MEIQQLIAGSCGTSCADTRADLSSGFETLHGWDRSHVPNWFVVDAIGRHYPPFFNDARNGGLAGEIVSHPQQQGTPPKKRGWSGADALGCSTPLSQRWHLRTVPCLTGISPAGWDACAAV